MTKGDRFITFVEEIRERQGFLWIPAFTGMEVEYGNDASPSVMPAQAGIQNVVEVGH